MKIGSLFTGIGGLDLGVERAGDEITWMCEREEFSRHVLRHRWPDVPIFRDATSLHAPEIDFLIGGFPCQPASLAGSRHGVDDPRWLWPAFRRAIRDLQPRFVLVENVPGLLKFGFDEVLGDLAALGFDAEWDCVPASALGAPHVRDRLFIVAYPEGTRLEGRIFDPDGAREAYELVASRGQWSAEPLVGRVADGIPAQLDRLWMLGSAVVPQVAEAVALRLRDVAT